MVEGYIFLCDVVPSHSTFIRKNYFLEFLDTKTNEVSIYVAPDFDTGTPKIKNRTFLTVLSDSRLKTGFSFALFLLI